MDTQTYKTRLEEERSKLEAELSRVATKDPNNPSNWDAVTPPDGLEADENVAADSIEDYEENTAITNTLESRLKDVVDALGKIDSNTYGKCEVCQKDIEEDRLEANPAARTCKEHINSLV